MPLQERGYTQCELAVSVLPLTNPEGDIVRKTQSGTVGGCNMRDDAVDGADFRAGTDASGAVGEDGAGRVGMRKDEEP